MLHKNLFDNEEIYKNTEGRYYLGNGLWTHPETGGDLFFDDERKNK